MRNREGMRGRVGEITREGEGGDSERSSIVCSSGEEERQRCGTSRLDNWYRT